MKRLVVAWLLLVLSGCASIPTEGPVEEVPISENPVAIDLAAEPPAEGANPSRLADGFLLAMADPEDNYAIARSYLTREAAQSWDPAEALVYDGRVEATLETASVVGDQLGILNPSGRFHLEAAQFTWDLGLVKENDEWRISNPPDRILLSRYLFARNYRTASLYFMDRSWEHVVPEPIHVPESALTPHALVESLLDGPPRSITAAVGTALPAGATLGRGGATINSQGVVTVDFAGGADSPVRGLSDDVWRRIGAQLLWTLTSLERVTGLLVTIDGKAVAMPGANADGVLEPANQYGYQVLSQAASLDLYGVRDGRPGHLSSNNTFLSWDDPGEPISDLAVSLDGAMAALISADATTVLVGPPNGPWTRIPTTYSNLRSPQVVGEAVWLLGDVAGQTRLLAVGASGEVNEVTVSLPWEARLVDFAVSPTGTRIALVIAAGDREHLGLAAVRPGPAFSLSQWEELTLQVSGGTRLTDFGSVAWTDNTSLAMVAAGGDQTSVFTSPVDGSLVEDLGVAGTVPSALTALPRLGGGPLALLTDTGATWRYEVGTRWVRATDQLTAVTYAS